MVPTIDVVHPPHELPGEDSFDILIEISLLLLPLPLLLLPDLLLQPPGVLPGSLLGQESFLAPLLLILGVARPLDGVLGDHDGETVVAGVGLGGVCVVGGGTVLFAG